MDNVTEMYWLYISNIEYVCVSVSVFLLFYFFSDRDMALWSVRVTELGGGDQEHGRDGERGEQKKGVNERRGKDGERQREGEKQPLL